MTALESSCCDARPRTSVDALPTVTRGTTLKPSRARAPMALKPIISQPTSLGGGGGGGAPRCVCERVSVCLWGGVRASTCVEGRGRGVGARQAAFGYVIRPPAHVCGAMEARR